MACQGVVTSAWRAVRVRSSRGAVAYDGRAGTYESPAALTTRKRLWAAGAEGRPTRTGLVSCPNAKRAGQKGLPCDAPAGASGGRGAPATP
jgi:hypothetical protein